MREERKMDSKYPDGMPIPKYPCHNLYDALYLCDFSSWWCLISLNKYIQSIWLRIQRLSMFLCDGFLCVFTVADWGTHYIFFFSLSLISFQQRTLCCYKLALLTDCIYIMVSLVVLIVSSKCYKANLHINTYSDFPQYASESISTISLYVHQNIQALCCCRPGFISPRPIITIIIIIIVIWSGQKERKKIFIHMNTEGNKGHHLEKK